MKAARLGFRKAVLSLCLVMSLVALETACGKVHVVNTPPGVIDTEVALWYQATGAVKTWADASSQLTRVAVDLDSPPGGSVYPSQDFYIKTLQALGKENQLGIEAGKYLLTVPQHFDATSQVQLGNYLDQGLATLDDATAVGLLQIKNPAAKQAVDTSITLLRSTLKTIFALVKPAGTPLPANLK